MGRFRQKNRLLFLLLVSCALALMIPAPGTASVRYVTQWGSFGGANGEFGGPIGLAAAAAGRVFVSDLYTNPLPVPRVQRFASDGNWQKTWGTYGVLPGQFTSPGAIATSPSGDVYVGDYSLNRIQRFDSDGKLTGSWGTSGQGEGQFASPWGIATDPNGRVYVVDYGNNRIQKFGPGGNYIGQWGSFGSGKGEFRAPTFIAADSKGHVFVADSGNSRIQKFSADGRYLGQWASPGPGAGVPDFPLGIATDPKGAVFVVGTNSIQKYRPDGSLLTRWGTYGKGEGEFRNPQGITTDSNGNIYVGDSGNNRVQKFHDSGPPYPDPGTARLGFQRVQQVTIRGGRTGVLAVRVRNTGSNPVKRVRICAPRSARASRLLRGVSCARLGTIETGKVKVARLRVAVRCVTARRVGLGLRGTAANARSADSSATIRITDCRRRQSFPWKGLG